MRNLSSLSSGGLLLGMSENGKRIYYNNEDTHSIIIGATRCGKTRCDMLPTICLLGLAGESIIASDPKGELCFFTAPFLERLGYEVITLDFKYPRKGNQYNFLQPVIDAVNLGDMPLAIKRARNVSHTLIPDGDHAEPIWTDGARSVVTAGIMAVVADNKEHPEFQNLNNVFHFVQNMCTDISVGNKSRIPLMDYIHEIGERHPARAALGISEIAPSKMRGSFYTSSLTNLELFTDPNISGMTSCTDFDIYATGKRKRAIFIILPDHEKMYHPIASLFISQHYQTLVDVSDKNGNRLPRRVNFVLDEFGNFVRIPDFDTAITVGGGRGMRFNLVLQDFNQLEKYDKAAKTIRSNCETWIYLQSAQTDTLHELTERLGKYTIKSPSLSGSTGGNSTASYNFTSRDLLTPDEIGKINRPYQLVITRNDPAIMYAPDISRTIFNPMLGLGNEEYNKNVIIRRNAARPERDVYAEPPLWGIWNTYIDRMKHMSRVQARGFGVEKYF
ncbi:MAG: type IV secretory system conjugative DNA transfer family protein [Oscillospiraceae bacterium]|nr:type IV secretory system conjugative DNA transfer family protein [Oscillospiraceae bacterium]